MSDFIKQKQVENLIADLAAKANLSEVLLKANNLSDLPNTGQARTNLDVYSTAEVDALISGAQNGFNVADIPARDALTGLLVSDRVFVSDDGDGKWALYLVTAITNGQGSTSTFQKIADQDLFDNAMTAGAIKAAYESNPDTNAYTDADKQKVDYITVTQPVNLDDLEAQVATNVTNINNAQTTATNALNAANTAQATANIKEDAFTETKETFSGLVVPAGQDFTVQLANNIKDGFEVLVFFGPVRVDRINWAAGSNEVMINVPYETEAIDEIYVIYKY
jgi:hypothetical protein